jgi:hypothetical protein
VRQGREWRIRNNEEIYNIIRKKNIVRFVKARRISWIGHVERMEDSRMPKSDERENLHQEKKG